MNLKFESRKGCFGATRSMWTQYFDLTNRLSTNSDTVSRLLQELIVLPRSTPPHLPSPYLLASYSHNLPLPLPPSNPSSAWSSQSVSVTAQIDYKWEVDITINTYISNPVYYARGREIPVFMSLTINTLTSLAPSSSTAGLGLATPPTFAEAYEVLRGKLILSLEAVFATGNNASKGFHIDTPLHELPHPSEIGAEVIIQHVKDSVPLWNGETAENQSQREDSKDGNSGYNDEKSDRYGKYSKVSEGKEKWLQGEIVPNGNVMPDFVAPNLRLTVSLTRYQLLLWLIQPSSPFHVRY